MSRLPQSRLGARLPPTSPSRARISTTTITPITITPSSSPATPGSSKGVASPRAKTRIAVEVINLHEDDDNNMGSGGSNDGDEEDAPTASAYGIKKNIDEDGDSKMGAGTENGCDDVAEDTPSPPRVILDLIDATCHEIIHLGGENMNSTDNNDEVKEFIIPSFASYATLARRLGYYMGLLKQGYPDGEQQQQPIVLEKGTDIWVRLVMAKLILDIFSKEAFPLEDFENFAEFQDFIRYGHKEPSPPSLMDMSPSRWSKLRWAFTELQNALHGPDEQVPSQSSGKMWKGGASLICVMKAFEALALLTKQLRRLTKTLECGINDDDNSRMSLLRERAIKDVGQYNDSKKTLKALLQKEGSEKYFSNLFVPSCPLHNLTNVHYYPSSIGDLEDNVFFILFFIHTEFKQKGFSVPHFKYALMNTLKDWERSYLPKPVLFNVGQYFKFGGEEELSSTFATYPQAEAKEVIFPEVDVVTKEPNQSAASNHSSKKKLRPMPESNRMRAKRIPRVKRPYTAVEKECLLKGVKNFGVGHWSDILNHYSDVFNVNQRSNVNLKDLYRTLAKTATSNKT